LKYLERIEYKGILLAIILRHEFKKEGIEFLTPENFTQQLGYMKRDKGYEIYPHVHNPVERKIFYTYEVLYIKSGSVRTDFYSEEKVYIKSVVLNKGDVILLANGAHGFYMLEKSEIIEVKQGPYAGEDDKTRFDPVSEDKILY
tara:strand:+ start:49 stop:480 length:432 start_codon:yes stop_codon:yes gene_type:complete